MNESEKELATGAFKLTRRDFLHATAIGALGAALLPVLGCSQSHGSTPKAVSVLGFVDVAQSLADDSLEGNTYWMDNNKRNGSTNEGTTSLVTTVYPGDTIIWVLGPLEVETYVSLEGLIPVRSDFAEMTNLEPVVLTELGDTLIWKGVISERASGLYEYALEIMVENKRMTTSPTMALLVG